MWVEFSRPLLKGYRHEAPAGDLGLLSDMLNNQEINLHSTAGVRESACRSLAVEVDRSLIDRPCRSKPDRVAVLSRGGGTQREHKARYTYSAASSALAPGARAQRTGIKAGLNFLSLDDDDDDDDDDD